VRLAIVVIRGVDNVPVDSPYRDQEPPNKNYNSYEPESLPRSSITSNKPQVIQPGGSLGKYNNKEYFEPEVQINSTLVTMMFEIF